MGTVIALIAALCAAVGFGAVALDMERLWRRSRVLGHGALAVFAGAATLAAVIAVALVLTGRLP